MIDMLNCFDSEEWHLIAGSAGRRNRFQRMAPTGSTLPFPMNYTPWSRAMMVSGIERWIVELLFPATST